MTTQRSTDKLSLEPRGKWGFWVSSAKKTHLKLDFQGIEGRKAKRYCNAGPRKKLTFRTGDGIPHAQRRPSLTLQL